MPLKPLIQEQSPDIVCQGGIQDALAVICLQAQQQHSGSRMVDAAHVAAMRDWHESIKPMQVKLSGKLVARPQQLLLGFGAEICRRDYAAMRIMR